MFNILLPTDFSENSKNAIRYALEFFKGKASTFYLLNVQKTSEYVTADVLSAPLESSVYDAVMADNKATIDHIIADYEAAYKNEPYHFKGIVDFDTLPEAISQTVSSHNIDLVVMGSNGATGSKEAFFGSNTLKVIRQVDFPLLIVPEGYTYQKPDSVLFSVHPGDAPEKEKLQLLFKLMEVQHQPQIHILNIDDDPLADTDETENPDLNAIFKNREHTYHHITGIPTPVAINAFVQLVKPSLHTMFVKKEGFLERFIFGSETSEISYGTRVPLLVLHQ
ncbi:universal stress protein [Marixanthomonas spongiae]|uniref:Universal stress protein n=1 Tax=Marixanthomonas spongiae TaxID=2174845 RepID=A0A2U0I437_9FLAO|nr:universal stress protein [Marixanthomonas spongiae]PVW15872.1 universal stress protein [Marixanthomonas spongiae]